MVEERGNGMGLHRKETVVVRQQLDTHAQVWHEDHDSVVVALYRSCVSNMPECTLEGRSHLNKAIST